MKLSKKSVGLYMIKANISSQKDLAAKAGISPNTMSSLMRGATGALETIGKIAAALNVDPSEIIED